METRQELDLTAAAMAFEVEADELVGWDVPADLGMPTAEEIELELALGHPAWGSLLRATE